MLGSACRLRLRPATVALAGLAVGQIALLPITSTSCCSSMASPSGAQAERRHRRTMSALGGSGRAAPFHANIGG